MDHYVAVAPGVGAVDWGSIFQTGSGTVFDILKSRYGQPPPGTYIQRGSDVFYRQGTGQTPLGIPPFAIGGGGGSLIWIGAGALLLVVVLMGARR